MELSAFSWEASSLRGWSPLAPSEASAEGNTMPPYPEAAVQESCPYRDRGTFRLMDTCQILSCGRWMWGGQRRVSAKGCWLTGQLQKQSWMATPLVASHEDWFWWDRNANNNGEMGAGSEELLVSWGLLRGLPDLSFLIQPYNKCSASNKALCVSLFLCLRE